MKIIHNASIAEEDISREEISMQKLEEALLLCGFGRFHIKLLIASMSAMFVLVAVTTSISNMLPSAECDLNMDIIQKGILNAVPFIGQAVTALFIGFLTDTFGRRVFLYGGHVVIFISNLLQAAGHSYWILVLGKFIEGICLSICFNTASVMVSECTHENVRDKALLVWSSFMPIAIIIEAFIAWVILPRQWDIVILNGYIELHSWNFYLLSFTIWSLLSGILFYYLPESPKFLLSCGREDDALDVIKTIYSINTGKAKESFPVTSLSSNKTINIDKTSLKKQLVNALFETKKIFREPLLTRLSLIMFINFISLLGVAALNLWYPQISTIIDSYLIKNGDSGQFCEMIDDYMHNLNESVNRSEFDNCTPRVFGFETYMLGIFVGLISLAFYVINICLVNVIGHKHLMFLMIIISAFCSGAIYWTSTLMIIAIWFSASTAIMITALGLLYNVLVRVFPTSLRGLAFAFVMIAGRIGNIMGSILFPVMLRVACIGPFICIFTLSIFIAGLIYFLPNPSKVITGSGDS